MIDHSFDYLRDVLSYNPATGVFVWKQNRGRRYVRGCVAGAKDKDGYTLITVDGKPYRAGRLAWWFVHGEWPKHEIDHINRDRSDDRIENLRSVSVAENRSNKRHTRKKSGLPSGVTFKGDARRAKPWAATIRIKGKLITLGHFSTAQDASAAYESARELVLARIGNDAA